MKPLTVEILWATRVVKNFTGIFALKHNSVQIRNSEKWILHRHLIDQKIPPLNLSRQKPLTGPHLLASLALYYISKCRSEVNKLNFKHLLVKDNLTAEEKATLISLCQRADIVIKSANKERAVVVWDWNLYLQEAERQLSDNTFYKGLDRDFTMDYNKTICEKVKRLS